MGIENREEHSRGLAVTAPKGGEPSRWAGVQLVGQTPCVVTHSLELMSLITLQSG